MSSVPWNSFRSMQYTQAGKLPPSHRRSPLTKKLSYRINDKNGECLSSAGAPGVCGNVATVAFHPAWDVTWASAGQTASGTSFWACCFAAARAFPETGTSVFHTACCPLCRFVGPWWLRSVTKLPSGFLSSSVSLLATPEPTGIGRRQSPAAKPGTQMFYANL